MSARTRTLHVDTERTWRGGERQALFLATGLRDRGHDVVVAGHRDGEFVRRARAAGLQAHGLPLRGELNPRAVLALRSLLAGGGFDLVHAHTSHAHMQCLLAARLAGRVPVIVSRRVDFPLSRSPWQVNRIKYRAGVARYIAISQAVKDVLVAGGVAPERIAIVPSGIDPTALEGGDPDAVRRELEIPPDAPVVGAVAHFAWHKGLEVLIDAAPRILAHRPDTRIVLVGDGELRDALRSRAHAAAPEETFRFPGWRPDAASFLRMFDVVAAPSLMEGLNTTNLDALALGRPLVASAVGGIPEAVHDGVTGLLVPKGDPRALAAAVIRLLSDPELAGRLGRAGQELVRRRFTADAMVEGTLEVYRSVLESRRPGG